TTYSGPFGSVSFRPVTAPPVGNFLKVNVSGSVVTIAWVGGLSSVEGSPPGSLSVRPGAPTVFSARALAGDGSDSPASVGFAWILAGSGWDLIGSATGPEATVQASG